MASHEFALDEMAEDEWMAAMSRYTVGPENLERVIGLVAGDISHALQHEILEVVRARYVAWITAVERWAQP